jgi:hypothetical protein
MSKKEIKNKKAEQKADRTVKLIFLSLLVLGLILMCWFAFSNS